MGGSSTYPEWGEAIINASGYSSVCSYAGAASVSSSDNKIDGTITFTCDNDEASENLLNYIKNNESVINSLTDDYTMYSAGWLYTNSTKKVALSYSCK